MKIGWRLWLVIITVILAILAIAPWNYFTSGVIIKSVEKNSTAFESGLRQGMIIKSINGHTVSNIPDYTKIISEAVTGNFTKIIITTKDNEFLLYTNKAPEITLSSIPKTNIKTGLDLSGGARALVKPANVSLSGSEIADLISITSERFNVFGLSDISIKPVRDLQGNNYMLIEIAGASPTDLKELVGKQGKFEAKIGNETVFVGGKQDITSVCRTDATCSRIESCSQVTGGGYACRFSFTVYLSETAAQRHADITNTLKVNTTEGGRYLEKKLDLYVDDSLADSLLISEELKGRVETQISVSGSGTGVTQQDAVKNAQENMKKLQTILITGSLPYKLEIVKLDTVSPNLGSHFIKYLLFAGIASLIAVSLIVLIRYRKLKISLAIILINAAEIIIILGFASLVKWNLDLASIAGILTTIGTGVDQQIIMTDESRSTRQASMIEKIKRALFIIVGAYFTAVASLVPLFWAGAGMLKGFAFTTIVGITIGVLITRPAFAEILKRIEG